MDIAARPVASICQRFLPTVVDLEHISLQTDPVHSKLSEAIPLVTSHGPPASSLLSLHNRSEACNYDSFGNK